MLIICLSFTISTYQSRIKETEARISQRDEDIQSLKTKLNSIEDSCFASFCRQIGVANIRQYEERELRTQQEREQKRIEFQNQKEQIMSQIDFEMSRAESGKVHFINILSYASSLSTTSIFWWLVGGNVARWEKTISELEDALEEKQDKEKETRGDVDRLVQLFESIKKDIGELKADIEKKVGIMTSLKRRAMICDIQRCLSVLSRF